MSKGIRISETQRSRDASGLGSACAACGNDATEPDPLVVSGGGTRIHRSHFLDAASGFYGEPYAEGAGS